MNEVIKLTKSQKERIDGLRKLMNESMSNYKDMYEIREEKIIQLRCNEISYYAKYCRKDAKTTAFADIVHVFISKRGKVMYYDDKEKTIKTFARNNHNIWTLYCANHISME